MNERKHVKLDKEAWNILRLWKARTGVRSYTETIKRLDEFLTERIEKVKEEVRNETG